MSLEPTAEQLAAILREAVSPAFDSYPHARSVRLFNLIRDMVLQTAMECCDDTDDNYVGRAIKARIAELLGPP